jgi:hypothetical protein
VGGGGSWTGLTIRESLDEIGGTDSFPLNQNHFCDDWNFTYFQYQPKAESLATR